MKRLLLLFSVLTTFISVTWAQIPEGYYQVYGGSMFHIFSWTPEYAKPGDVVTVTRVQSGNQILKVKKVSGKLNNVYDPITVTKVEGDVETYTFVMPQFDEDDDYVEISGVTLQPFAILSNDHKTLTFMGIDTDDADPFANITGSHLQYYDYSSAQQGQDGLDASVMDFVDYCHNEVETVVLDPSLSATSSMIFTYVRLFYNFSKLTTIVGLEDMNMQQARGTTEMFAGCSSLTSLTIGSNFYVPEKGTTPYGEKFDFDASDMFKGCDGLENGTLIVKGTTPPVIEQYIFSCFTSGTLITEPIDLLDYSVTRDNMGNVYYCGGTFTKFNSTDVPYVSLSSDGTTLTFINGEKPTTGQVWDLTDAWSTATNGSVTTVAFDETFKNVPITSCEGWFSGFTKLTTVDARFLNLGRCSSTKEMFADCSSLNDLTIGDNFFIGQADTYNTTDMFKGCTAMASGTVTIVNTSPASGMYPIINQDIFSVITNGTLMTGNGVDLSTYVEEKDDGFRCLGGIFTTYNDKQILTIRLADPTKAASKDNPYIINNVDDMVILSKAVNAGEDWTKNTWIKIATANEIFDFDGITGFEPIGTSTNKFTSSFDGNGVTIKNLNLSGTTYTGVFGYASGGWTHTIENIRIDNSSSFASSGNYLGSLAGYAEGITINNCHNDGATVTASGTATEVGGLIGYMLSGTISDCSSNANVSGYTDVGGLMGHAGYGNGKVEMYNNTVGMALSKDETICITATAGAVGAIVGSVNTCSGTGNYYNGQAITAKQGAKELTGYGFGVNLADNAYIMSATGGLFATVNPGHTGKTLTWSYDLYSKAFTINGSPDPGYELTSVTISYKDANGDVQKLVRNKEQLDESWAFEVQNYPTNVEAICETALKLADPTQPASKENPYLINNVNDMVTLSKAVNANQSFTKNTWFKVAKENDVFDFDGITDFEPIGTSTNKFTSRFDGNGVTIKNLRLTGDEYVGLFGCGYYTTTTSYVKSEISNITIDASCSFTANTNYAGAIVATTNYTDIINCHNMGATVIATTSYAGGIVAQAGAGSTISECTSKANVTSNWYAGGIAGLVSYATMTNNLVGMGLEEDETITINCGNGGGAIVSNINNVSGSDNFYNGMAVILNSKNTTYQGQGYAYWRSDNDFLKSATGGYCGVTSENSGKNVEWKYDLYTKDFTVFGTGGTADYTESMAPSIVKDEIETLTISEGVTGIGAKAFSGCTSLNTVIFDGCTLTSAASDAFGGCTAMAEGTVIINKAIPIGDGVGTDFLSIVTNGSLKCDATSNLKAEVERQGDTFLWKGGTFGIYQQELAIANITFGEKKYWTTYYSDENIKTPDGVTAYVVSDIEDNTVTVSSIDYIPANVGVLLYSETSGSIHKSYLFTGNEQNYYSMLEGSLDGMTLTKEAGYILLNNEFVLTSGGQLAAHRCYLPIAKRSNKILARVMSIGWGSQTGTTDIENINSDDKTTDDHWYTLDGRKLDKAPVRKGLYIHGRRKVIVK